MNNAQPTDDSKSEKYIERFFIFMGVCFAGLIALAIVGLSQTVVGG